MQESIEANMADPAMPFNFRLMPFCQQENFLSCARESKPSFAQLLRVPFYKAL